jgi:hypothetical protein
MINILCNTLKLAIFSLYAIHVLRLINILSMKYFFEIENWQKYFGFIFKQGSNASTTSMHPTPLVSRAYLAVRFYRRN